MNTKMLGSSAEARRHGAIICWRHESNGAELAMHVGDASLEEAVRLAIARLIVAERPLDLWRCVSVSTPQTIYRDLTRGGRAKADQGRHHFEGHLAAEILDELGLGV